MARRPRKKEDRTKNISIKLSEDKNVIDVLFKPIIPFGIRQETLNPERGNKLKMTSQLSQISKARQLLNKEKIKIIYAIKEKKPKSIYELSKILGRNFKAVRQDLRLLESLEIIAIKHEIVKNRPCSRPILNIDKINLMIEF
jgi:predicted transcriptional regulator